MWYIIGGLLIIILLLYIFAANYFYRLALGRNKKTFLEGDPALQTKSLEDASRKQQSKQIRELWFTETKKEDVFITSQDGLKLRGIILENPKPTNRFIVLAHGYSNRAEDMKGFAKFYQETYGCHILLPDARGHGQSEGNYIGMGWPDRLDYLQWLEYLINRYGENSIIGLHGVSMGGATVMMVSGETLPSQVKYIIEDCGFSGVRPLFSYQLKRMFKLPAFPLIQLTSFITKMRAGYTFEEASSINQVIKTQVPMLFIHGDEDAFVPFSMLDEVYDVKTGIREKLVIKGAQHGNAFYIDEERGDNFYKEAVANFMNRYMK